MCIVGKESKRKSLASAVEANLGGSGYYRDLLHFFVNLRLKDSSVLFQVAS